MIAGSERLAVDVAGHPGVDSGADRSFPVSSFTSRCGMRTRTFSWMPILPIS